MNVQRRTIQGCNAGIPAGATPTRAIALPQLPTQGSMVVTGTVTAADQAAGKQVTYFVQGSISVSGGVATPVNDKPPPVQPSDAGAAQFGAALGGLNLVTQGQQAEITVAGVSGHTLTWSWDLDVTIVNSAAS